MESTGLPETVVPANSRIGHHQTPPPDLELDDHRSGNKTPIGTRPTEIGHHEASFFPNKEHDHIKDDQSVPASSRTASVDDSVFSSFGYSRSNTALSSTPSTPGTVATSVYFDEPQLDDTGDVSPSRVYSLPVRGAGRNPLRSDSIDSECSAGFAPIPRPVRRLKNSTFPIQSRDPQRQGSSEQPHRPSALRTASFPSPPSPILERDSGLGDEPDDPEIMHEPDVMDDINEDSDPTPHDSDANDPDDDDKEMATDVSSNISIQSSPLVNHLPEGGLLEELCNYMLRRGFNTEFSELNGRSQAWEAILRCWYELSGIVDAEDSPASDGMDNHPSEVSSTSGLGNPSNNGSSRKKRGRDNGGGPGEDGFNGDGSGYGGDGFGGPSAPKKFRVLDSETSTYSCPFRKRNPLRFNIRDHQPCATVGHKDISSLKRHVKTFHTREQRLPIKIVCPRCKEPMDSGEALEQHQMVPADRMCKPRKDQRPGKLNLHYNPEDGISEAVETALCGRANHLKINNWKGLWQALFPNDADNEIKSAEFCPPIELDEVLHKFRQDSKLLVERLQPYPHSSSLMDPQTAGDVCQIYIEEMFERCRNTVGSVVSTLPTRRRNVKPSQTNTPSTPSPPSARPLHPNNHQVHAPVETSQDASQVRNHGEGYSDFSFLSQLPQTNHRGYEGYTMMAAFPTQLGESSIYHIHTPERNTVASGDLDAPVASIPLLSIDPMTITGQPDMLNCELATMPDLVPSSAMRDNGTGFDRPPFQNDEFCAADPSEFKGSKQHSSKDSGSWDRFEEFNA